MRDISLEELLEAGCHFGHQVTRQNPKARDFVFEERDNIHIIDLAKTKEGLEAAGVFVRDLAAKPQSTFLIVGTKRQARPIVEEEIKRAGGAENGVFYVTNRWIGGTFTNLSEVAKNYKKLQDLGEKIKNDEEKAKYTKREVGLWEKERQKLQLFYGGVASMKRLPDAIFIIDTHLENLAGMEAKKMGVVTIGIVDTNADPLIIDHPIPANDDAVGSIKLIVSYIVDAWIEGKVQSSKLKVQSGTIKEPKVNNKVGAESEMTENKIKKTMKETKEVKSEEPKKEAVEKEAPKKRAKKKPTELAE